MAAEWVKARQTRYTAYATFYVLIVLGVLGTLNYLANRYTKSYDTTANKRFTLSDQTTKIVKELKDDIRITYFDKADNFQRAKDLLDRYNTLSPKLHVDYVDPEKKPLVARAAGIRNLGSIVVNAGPKREEAKSLTEEEVTGALIRTIKTGDRTVCAVSGSGEHSLDQASRESYSKAKELLGRDNYKTKTISLLEKAEVPKDCTVLMVGGPRFDYAAPAVEAIKKYVEAGGRALFLIDPPVTLGKEDISENASLVAQLAEWGVTPNKDLVLDTSGVGQLFGVSEVVPLVSSYESHPIVNEMRGTATGFPLARSLEAKTGGKWTASKLFSTSENSYATTNLGSREIRINPDKDKKGPLTLGMAASTGQSRIVVVGSSGWIADSFVGFNGNRDLFLNMVNWLSSDEQLISIRPKDPEDRRLALNRQQMSMILYTSVLLIPLAIIASGISVWWKRR